MAETTTKQITTVSKGESLKIATPDQMIGKIAEGEDGDAVLVISICDSDTDTFNGEPLLNYHQNKFFGVRIDSMQPVCVCVGVDEYDRVKFFNPVWSVKNA